jgi:hypothetical protein
MGVYFSAIQKILSIQLLVDIAPKCYLVCSKVLKYEFAIKIHF